MNVGWLVAGAFEATTNAAERLTGLDLDRDGDIGVAGHNNRAQPVRAEESASQQIGVSQPADLPKPAAPAVDENAPLQRAIDGFCAGTPRKKRLILDFSDCCRVADLKPLGALRAEQNKRVAEHLKQLTLSFGSIEECR